ncbi:MAG: hypothetical protein GY803_09630 [Chloroflexi bacterium]|nr:hypothetical protein [Chloroflexota bacterium]
MDSTTIVAILVLVSIIGLAIVLRPHPPKTFKNNAAGSRSHSNDMSGWSIND